MRVRKQTKGLFSLLLAALLYACTPYVAPSLPIMSDTVQYRLVPITQQTANEWRLPDVAAPPTPLPAGENYDYIVGPGDMISLVIYTFDATGEQSAIRVFPEGLPISGEDEFLVSADGTVTLPYVGNIYVQGLPFAKVNAMIEAGLRDYFIEPQFSARVSQYAHGRVLVTGEVEKPGQQLLTHRPLSIPDAIQQAGGALPTADITHITLTRANGAIELIDLRALYYTGDSSSNRILATGDHLTIPRGHANQIFLTGEVLDPQAITMHPMGFSLTEALQNAGGISPITGDPSHIYVLRAGVLGANATGEVSIYHLDASSLPAFALADQFILRPRDIIYVSMQPVTQWDRVLSQFLPGGLSTVIGPQVEPRL